MSRDGYNIMDKRKIISPDSFIRKSCRLGGGVRIGPHCDVGQDCVISMHTRIGASVHIGSSVYIGTLCKINSDVIIEPYTVLAARVHVRDMVSIAAYTILEEGVIVAGYTVIGDVGQLYPDVCARVTVGAGASIGCWSVIGHSVTIEPGVIIPAYSKIPNYERVNRSMGSKYKISWIRYIAHNVMNGLRVRFGKPTKPMYGT